MSVIGRGDPTGCALAAPPLIDGCTIVADTGAEKRPISLDAKRRPLQARVGRARLITGHRIVAAIIPRLIWQALDVRPRNEASAKLASAQSDVCARFVAPSISQQLSPASKQERPTWRVALSFLDALTCWSRLVVRDGQKIWPQCLFRPDVCVSKAACII